MDKKSEFTTVYEAPDAGMLTFQSRAEFAEEIDSYLTVLAQLRADYAGQADVIQGLKELELKLTALRVSQETDETVQKKLKELSQVAFGPGKNLDLSAFRKKAAQNRFGSPEEYEAHVRKLIRNTSGNITQLILFHPNDNILQRFLEELQKLDKETDLRELRFAMEKMGKSPQLWHYNEKKKEFLAEWLRPFQDLLGGPIAEMSEKELQEALKKVESLRDSKLVEMTNLSQVTERAAFRKYNAKTHAIINGKNADFWGDPDVRDEFIKLTTRIVQRFSFALDDRFLLFKTKDEGFCYLVGFADDALTDAVTLDNGSMAFYPHMKVFLKSSEGKYNEITREMYSGDKNAYYRALKTAIVPFVTAISVMVEFELSDGIKNSFDMWT